MNGQGNFEASSGLNRRRFLDAAAVTAAAGMAAASSARAGATSNPDNDADGERGSAVASVLGQTVDFFGPHQAGIETPVQASLQLVGLDLKDDVDRAALRRLMRLWTEDAAELTAGRSPLGSLEPELEARPANLTITCGLGRGALVAAGLEKRAPAWLNPVPVFSRDRLDEAWGQTDLVLQICGDDPVTTSHALRHMIRSGTDYIEARWLQQGFMNSPGILERGETPRNLFGQKDGTVNPRSPEDFEDVVWIPEDASRDVNPGWLGGGSAMVVRRIQMHMNTWEALDRVSRETVIGRTLKDGAPLSGGDEFTDADFGVTDEFGLPRIDPASHMARATPPADRPHEKILRRAYNYEIPVTGVDQKAESPVPLVSEVGLVFVCYQQDPREQFTAIQRRLDQEDRLNEWITHIGSAVYAVPPGVAEGGYWAEELLGE